MASFGVVEGAALASVLVSAAGTGMNMYAQQQQADSQQSIADYNYRLQKQNAEVNARIAAQQAQWQQQNARLQYDAQQQNATALNNQARATEAQAREEARRQRMENERVLSMQRSRYAKAGVENSGTPLMVMAETAGMLELALQDKNYTASLEASSLDRQADMERYQSGFSLFDEHVAKYEEAVARTGRSIDLNKAALDYYSGSSSADGARLASYGSLLSGVAGGLNQVSEFDWLGSQRKKATKSSSPKKSSV